MKQLTRQQRSARVTQLLERLPRLSGARRSKAIQDLGGLGNRRAVGPLLAELRSCPPKRRVFPAVALGELRGERAFRGLSRILRESRNPHLRFWTLYSLTWFHELRAFNLFLEIARDPAEAPMVRGQALEGIAYLMQLADRRKPRHARVVNALLELLEDPEPEVRFWTAFALGSLRAREALSALRRVAESDDGWCPGWWSIADEASDAIDHIAGRSRRVPQRIPLGFDRWPDDVPD